MGSISSGESMRQREDEPRVEGKPIRHSRGLILVLFYHKTPCISLRWSVFLPQFYIPVSTCRSYKPYHKPENVYKPWLIRGALRYAPGVCPLASPPNLTLYLKWGNSYSRAITYNLYSLPYSPDRGNSVTISKISDIPRGSSTTGH